MKCKKACLVINPRAGQNLAQLTAVMAVLAAAGWKTDIAIKEYGGHTMELGTRAAEKNYDLVIAYGGDGTLNEVLNGIADENGLERVRLGVLPLGTVNVFAKELNLPQHFERSWEVIRRGKEISIDLPRAEFRVNEKSTRRYFAQMAGAGLDFRSVRRSLDQCSLPPL